MDSHCLSLHGLKVKSSRLGTKKTLSDYYNNRPVQFMGIEQFQLLLVVVIFEINIYKKNNSQP